MKRHVRNCQIDVIGKLLLLLIQQNIFVLLKLVRYKLELLVQDFMIGLLKLILYVNLVLKGNVFLLIPLVCIKMIVHWLPYINTPGIQLQINALFVMQFKPIILHNRINQIQLKIVQHIFYQL